MTTVCLLLRNTSPSHRVVQVVDSICGMLARSSWVGCVKLLDMGRKWNILSLASIQSIPNMLKYAGHARSAKILALVLLARANVRVNSLIKAQRKQPTKPTNRGREGQWSAHWLLSHQQVVLFYSISIAIICLRCLNPARVDSMLLI